MSAPRTEIRIVNVSEDGSEEVIEGIHLDMSPENPNLIAEWGTDYPERREEFDARHPYLVLDRGRQYLTLHIVAPLIPDSETGTTFTVRRTTAAALSAQSERAEVER